MHASHIETTPPLLADLDAHCRSFEENGYLTFEGLVDKAKLAALSRELFEGYIRESTNGRLFQGGGTVSGHLNCFPGSGSRFVYSALEEHGVFELVRALSPAPLRAPNIGCNFNLPGSHSQNDHVDGDPARPFLVVNVATVDTDLTNGAMEVLAKTHRRTLPYWKLLLENPERLRIGMKQGDVLIRVSTLWHRGMPNLSPRPRAMLAFTWEDGGSHADDPYRIHDGHIKFLPNRYGTDWAGRLRERAFSASPRIGTAYLAIRSLF